MYNQIGPVPLNLSSYIFSSASMMLLGSLSEIDKFLTYTEIYSYTSPFYRIQMAGSNLHMNNPMSLRQSANLSYHLRPDDKR